MSLEQLSVCGVDLDLIAQLRSEYPKDADKNDAELVSKVLLSVIRMRQLQRSLNGQYLNV